VKGPEHDYQIGNYLTDNPSLDGLWDWIKVYREEHPNEIEKLTIYFD